MSLGSSRKAQPLRVDGDVIEMDEIFGNDEKLLFHDGMVREENIHFTAVNGSIVATDRMSRKAMGRIDFSSQCEDGRKAGWSQSMRIVGDNYIDISKTRYPKFKEYINWMVTGHRGNMLLSVIEVVLTSNAVSDSYDMRGFRGCEIYSTIRVT